MVARVATFDDAPTLHPDDERRVASLRDLVRAAPGFIAGYHLREENNGRLMSVTIWQSDEAMINAEEAVQNRPSSEQRGIRPSRIERWIVDAEF